MASQEPTPPKKFMEMRKQPRHAIDLPTTTVKSPGGLINFGKVLVLDISETGMQVESEHVVTVDERVLIETNFTNTERLDYLRGRVRWVKQVSLGCRFGIEFESITPGAVERMKHRIGKHLGLFGWLRSTKRPK